jgi:hypothetical protein
MKKETIMRRARGSVQDIKEGDFQVDLGSVSFRDGARLRQSNQEGADAGATGPWITWQDEAYSYLRGWMGGAN